MLLTNAKFATITGNKPYGLIEDCAVAIIKDKIEWVGNIDEVPSKYDALTRHDLARCLVTPGLIDCHTHIVHGGNRANEFEMRLNGASYEAIARSGGGIVSTVSATRNATEDELVQSALPRLDALILEGVTTIEVKSGYGLDRETELRMLRAARQLAHERPINVTTTFLGAHAIPAEYSGNADQYIDEVCIPTMLTAHDEGLVDAVDGFCEEIAFSTEQIGRVFKNARDLGLPIKLHAEQLSNIGGTQLAAQYSALSVDHIEYANEADAKALSASGTVAVILPGAFYTLRETQLPPIEHLRTHNVGMAIATDCNPGSSPLTSLLLTMNMACTLFRMTPEEALKGVTANAAKALDIGNVGSIEVGNRADLCVWDVKHPAELSYRIGFNPLKKRIFGGRL